MVNCPFLALLLLFCRAPPVTFLGFAGVVHNGAYPPSASYPSRSVLVLVLACLLPWQSPVSKLPLLLLLDTDRQPPAFRNRFHFHARHPARRRISTHSQQPQTTPRNHYVDGIAKDTDDDDNQQQPQRRRPGSHPVPIDISLNRSALQAPNKSSKSRAGCASSPQPPPELTGFLITYRRRHHGPASNHRGHSSIARPLLKRKISAPAPTQSLLPSGIWNAKDSRHMTMGC